MARPHPRPTTDADRRDASARSRQELYGRREPPDLAEADIGRDSDTEDPAPDPGRGSDASGRPSTARSGANTQ